MFWVGHPCAERSLRFWQSVCMRAGSCMVAGGLRLRALRSPMWTLPGHENPPTTCPIPALPALTWPP